ncbi:MAG TPA: O-antigen ligase family protein [Blastocatellia bacterium]|nr:O-antigen ligase family protein [Blastocatellia bacterium]
MDISHQKPNRLFAALPPLRLTASLILLTLGLAFAGTLCATGDYRNAVVVTAVSLGAAFLLAAPIAIEAVLPAWFATTPLASFYLRYPLDRSIITYNRALFGLLVVMLVLDSRSAFKGTTALSATSSMARAILSLSKFEIAWALLSLLALASAVAHSNNVAYATRIATDTFWLPLIVFYFARKHFDLRTAGRLLLLACMALALFLLATGVFELATGIDLFQYKGSELVREGERRVNGPFAADSSFAIICLILFLFLLAAPRLIGVRFDRAGKLFYVCATAAAALGALLSLFRVVAFALVICWIAQRWFVRRALNRGDLRRFLPVVSLTAVILIVLGGWLATMVQSTSGSRLADPRSAFGRLATWQAAAEIAVENPVFGVGLANYADYYDASHYYSDEPPEEVLDTKAADSPHSNLLWIASELGLPGLALYIAANLYLFLIGWRALKRAVDHRQRIAASCFLALVVAYWIPGLTLASGYYSDLNLCFLFLLGALSTEFSGLSPASKQS